MVGRGQPPVPEILGKTDLVREKNADFQPTFVCLHKKLCSRLSSSELQF